MQTTTKIEWIPCTEKRYYEMLGVLPPAAYGSMLGATAFQVGEPMDHKNGRPTFAAFKAEIRVMGDKYYESAHAVTFAEFKSEFSNAVYHYVD